MVIKELCLEDLAMIKTKTKTKTNPNKEIIFWDAIIDLAYIDNKGYHDTVTKLVNNEYEHTSLEKLALAGTNPLYSIRLNNTNRLLCTTLKVEEKSYLLLLEIAYNHDYHKARFMQAGVLDSFVERNGVALQTYIKAKLQSNATTENPNNNRKTIRYQSVSLHQNKLIQLSIEQMNALERRFDQSLLISGGPGSGKSVLALSLLDKQLTDTSIDQETLLYVTQSEGLVHAMQKQWDEQTHTNLYNKQVVFTTYKDLLKRQGLLHGVEVVNKDYFTLWLKLYLSNHTKKKSEAFQEMQTLHGGDTTVLQNLIYQEFRIISGYELQRYSSLNVKSLFNELKHRQWLWEAYSAYLDHLKSNQKVHLAFMQPNTVKINNLGLIVVDESQDFSLGELRALHSGCTHNAIVFFNDSHQILEDNKSKASFIMELCGKSLGRIELSGSYRCSPAVTAFADAIMKLKLHLTGGLSDKFQSFEFKLNPEQEQQQDPKNTVQWFQHLEDISNQDELLSKLEGSAQVAVVTLPQYKKEIQERFNHKVSVFTPDEIKGLEFPLVIAYNLLDEEGFKQANQDMVPRSLKQTKFQRTDPRPVEKRTNTAHFLIASIPQ